MIRRVRRKPTILEAVRFDGSLENRVFLEGWVRDPESGRPLTVAEERVYVPTLEGTMIGSLGDWIVRGVAGEFYPVRADIFEQIYEIEE